MPLFIRNFWAVGRNYAEHAKELGNQVPEPAGEPMIFLKAGTSLVENHGEVHLPSFTQDIHHEVEIAYRFGPDLRFSHVSIALDLTAREVQSKLKSKGHPWTLAKSFKDSCCLGPVVALQTDFNGAQLEFWLKVNGEVRQRGSTRDMIHDAEKLRLYVIDRFPVVEGDWLLTGTPEGVGPIRSGDRLEAAIASLNSPSSGTPLAGAPTASSPTGPALQATWSVV